jgi:hypothetical protein
VVTDIVQFHVCSEGTPVHISRMEGVNNTGGRREQGRHIPQEDLILRHELRVCEENNWDCYLCPCKECHGGHRYSIRTIREHL